ncbi:MAG: dihydroorotate dehydrogenase-like protein [Dysgonamonadaceae bacterium]|jgi:dihydroorotate dehydrogenase (fumarate)|nr:dihydroorotate dehydrogenase-like protein [Dysgonamonadaceae bacterium]
MEKILTTNFAGLDLISPVLIGSSGLTNTPEKNTALEKAGAGAVILPSIFEEQIEIQTGKNTWTDSPKAHDYVLNSLNGMQLDDYLQLIKKSKKSCRIPVIASINCYRNNGWIDFVRKIETAGADAIELNIFGLNTEIDRPENTVENIYVCITRQVKSLVNIPVIVKMSKYFSHIVKLTDDVRKAGADGVVLFSRFYQPDIDIHLMQANSGYVFSSNAEIADTLRWTSLVGAKLPDVSIASCTGIHDWEDIIKCILCGASAVELCSTVYQHGNEIIQAMNRSLEEWMLAKEFKSIEEVKKQLNFDEIQDPSLHERIQFMKYFSNRD